jgi:hypothetical protein
VVFIGAPGARPFPGASGKVRSRFAGVGGGEIKATFLWTSLLAVTVLTLPLVVLRVVRGEESCSVREEVVRVMGSETMSVGGGRGGFVREGVVKGRGSAENGKREEDSKVGRGRIESSGRGLKEEVGVEVARSGGGH